MTNWSKLIPSETAAGQLGLFAPGAYKIPKPKASDMRGTAFSMKPPFKPTGVGRPASGTAASLARGAETSMKASVDAAVAAIKQQNSMDIAKAGKQITDREIMMRNKILMKRRKRAGI
jgi:hypothetical protein